MSAQLDEKTSPRAATGAGTPATRPDPLSHTPSGIEVPVVVTPEMGASDGSGPGEFPYTRGIFPDGYRGRLWTIRQYSGFGTAEETNSVTASCSTGDRPACRSRSTCRRSAATIPSTRWPVPRAARSASRSRTSPTPFETGPKKRLRLAEWRFGGGDRSCEATRSGATG